MATPNYSYEKRQRELAKKRKNEEKAQKKKQSPGESDSGPESHPPPSMPGDPGNPPATS